MVTKLERTEKGVMLQLSEVQPGIGPLLETLVYFSSESLVLAELGLDAEAEVSITVRPEQGQIIITAADAALSGVDEEFAQQVSAFIDQYRPALEALAR